MKAETRLNNRPISKLMLREDHKFLFQQLLRFPEHKRRQLKQKYKNLFLAAMDKEPAEHKKENAGRYAANVWIREHKYEI